MPRALCIVVSLFLFALPGLAQESRHFTFHYAFTVKNVTAGKKVRVWIPAAHGDPFQDVTIISSSGDLPLKSTRESKFGNEMYFASTRSAAKAELQFEIVYDVTRRERVALPASNLVYTGIKVKPDKAYLQADALVPTTGLPAELAVKVTQGKTDPLDKARAIYDYVFTTMKYDKTGTGWGRGDVLYACDAKKGNCTDFHSLFIAMARSQGIPARFEIGFPLPPDKHSAEIAGYH
ncbi:MAG: transglutaminase-like domain-containing protein, partial [Candidatus Sulfotelmatobacter sp.]